MTRPLRSSTAMFVAVACVITSRRFVAIAFGIVLTAVEFFALTWQPPRLQKPWYWQPGRSSYASEFTAAGPGNGCQPSLRAAVVICSVNAVLRKGGMG